MVAVLRASGAVSSAARRVVAHTAHRIPQRVPLRLEPGEGVHAGEHHQRWPQLVFVTCSHGSGWVPASRLSADAGPVEVRAAYDTTELPTRPGERLRVLDEDPQSGWLWCQGRSGASGWVPASSLAEQDGLDEPRPAGGDFTDQSGLTGQSGRSDQSDPDQSDQAAGQVAEPAVGARPITPAQAWSALRRGNARFVSGEHAHPHQDANRRERLAAGQRPIAVFFGCGDSRVAAEIVFDQGLGDLFVVRTAGHVIDSGVLGSIEFGVWMLDIPLIVVLGHDSCGAVAATLRALDGGELPRGYIRDIVERVTPSVLAGRRKGLSAADEMAAEHVRQSVSLLLERSQVIAEGVASGAVGIVGATYQLADGRARMVDSRGQVSEP